MSVSCNRPYPNFRINVDEFVADDCPSGTRYDIGLCYIAYKNIIELYNRAADLVETLSDDNELAKNLKNAVKKTHDDFKQARFIIDETEINSQNSRWKKETDDGGIGEHKLNVSDSSLTDDSKSSKMTDKEQKVIECAFNLVKSVVTGDYHLPAPMNRAINEIQDAVYALADERGYKCIDYGCSREFLQVNLEYWENLKHTLEKLKQKGNKDA